MFLTFILNVTATPKPQSIKGMDCSKLSAMFFELPNAPENIFANAFIGLIFKAVSTKPLMTKDSSTQTT